MQTPFGRYVLDARIGAGGMAEVHRARLVGDGFEKPVCIKRVLPAFSGLPGFADMLRDEAALAARLRHQNVVQTLDFGEVDGQLFIAMELVEGTNLGRMLAGLARQRAHMKIAQAVQIAASLCRGLHHAHTAVADGRPLHIVHRDVTPQNVLLSHDGEVKLADFGVARASERLAKTATGVIKGKTGYMAPEQAAGEPIDHRVDQFATGVVLWECLVGKRLFMGPNELLVLDAVARCQVPAPSTLRKDVPRALDAIVLRALARAPAERFADSAALGDALAELLFAIARRPADVDLRALVAEAVAPAEDTAPILRAAPPEPATVEDAPVDDSDDPTASGAHQPAYALDVEATLRNPRPPIDALAATDGRPGRIGARATLAMMVGAGAALGVAAVLIVSGALEPDAAAPRARAASASSPIASPIAAPGAAAALATTPVLAIEPASVSAAQARALLAEAGRALADQRNDDALALLVKVEALAPRLPAVHMYRGVAHARRGDKAAAYHAYRRYLELAPAGAERAQVASYVAAYESARAGAAGSDE